MYNTCCVNIKVLFIEKMIIISRQYLRVESLGHMKKYISLTLKQTAKLFSRIAVLFNSHTNNAWEFQLLHILTNT